MSIAHWPEAERPREKLLLRGAKALSDAELLAIFLRTGSRGKSAVDLARDLLNHFKSLRALLLADHSSICQLPGMGTAKYVQFQACLELGNRHLAETLAVQDALSNPAHTYAYLTQKLRDRTQEVFACLFLNSQNQVLAYKELFFGTLTSSAVYPREVVQEALRNNAASVIFSHNHPSGNPRPSQADKILTARLRDALATVDIRVLDHIIIGNGQICSFAQKALL